MPERYAVAARTAFGKRSKRLRREGVLPANVYGRGLDSVAVQLPRRGAEALLAEHGLNSLIEIGVEGEDGSRPVVVRSVQRHPLTRELQHLDFYQVDLARPMQAQVPVTLTGEAPAVHTYQGILITGLDRVAVEALPADIPSHVELPVGGLEELDAQLTVGDLRVAEGVRVMTEPGIMLARIARPRVSEAADAAAELAEGEEPPPGADAPAAEADADAEAGDGAAGDGAAE